MRKGTLGIRCMMALMLVAAMAGCKEDPVGNTPQPPGPPRNFRAVEANVQAPTIELQWDAPQDSSGLTGYRIWWQVTGGAMDSTDVAATARTFTRDVLEATSYTFSIAAKRGTLRSELVTVQWGGIHQPSQPQALTVEFVDSVTARLQWTASADTDLTGYLLAWRDLKGIDSMSVSLPAAATTHNLPDMSPGKQYIFYLYAQRNMRFSLPDTTKWDGFRLIPSPPQALEVTSLSASSVSLRWLPSSSTTGVTYRLVWRQINGGNPADAGGAVTDATSYVVTGLTPGRTYEFSVRSVRNWVESISSLGVTWSGAMRYTTEPGGTTPIRMYETQSANGPGLTLDPPQGPKNVSVGASNNVPNSVQLALYTTGGNNNQFEIGPAYAFTEYKQADKFDQNVYVSDSAFPATSLDTWFAGNDLELRFPSNGNVRAFLFPAAEANNGMGFYVRTGRPGNYHYARVFIKNVGGMLLQGTAPNRFVELEISYQTTANLPFAQPANMRVTPASVGSYVRRRP